jgi:hypothetical protein
MLTKDNCQICLHSKRENIDASIGAIGQRKTAAAFKISRQAIQRHLDPDHQKLIGGQAIANLKKATRALPEAEAEPFEDPTLAHDGLGDAPEPEQADLEAAKKEEPTPRQKRHQKVVKARAVPSRLGEQLARTMSDYTTRKRYVGKLLRTGTFNGMPTLERLRGCWPDLTMLGLAEIVAQAAMEADFLRGTRQARRLVVLAKADKIYRESMELKDYKMALRALEFTTKVDGISAEPDLAASLASSQAWAITARVLQAKFPEAFEAIHGELVAEEARRRHVLAPAMVESETT